MAEDIVNPDLYTTDYFINEATGGHSYGQAQSVLLPYFKIPIDYADIVKDVSILDVGCGRGEVLYHTAQYTKESVGVDYSSDAIKLTEGLIYYLPSEFKKKIKLYCDDINNILPTLGKFDRVFLLDVVEHMYPYQLEKMYKELLARHLNKGAIMIISTPIADSKQEKHFFLDGTMQEKMHINLNSFEEHTKYFKDEMYIERPSKRFIKAILR